jgi:catechol 2,3-dioxygenase-like lactoylglutathione lyase family enzyme
MQQLISNLLDRYERGQLTRRDLIGGIAAFATAAQATPATASSTFHGVDVNHLALKVTDVQRSRDFYQKLLGMPVVSETASNCFLGLGDNFLALFKNREPGLDHYCLSIEDYDVDRVTGELKRQGLNPRQPSGTQRVYFDDPDGIEVQLSSPRHQP